MKIERLHFKNINSLKGEHKVNFDEHPLDSGGLFAIIGPTGSGKSTLLDVICLALYSRTPRISSVNKNKIEQDGSILTKYQKEAYAKVKFSCRGGRFIATWSISTNRNGNLREYDMDLWNLETESSYSEKKTEVLSEIQRLIGLSYDQFVKSVVLSQGEFATLLKSNEKERSELLEKITNTSIYRTIGRKVYEKYTIIKDKISNQKTLLEDYKLKLLSDEELNLKHQLKAKLEADEKAELLNIQQYEKDLNQLQLKNKREEDFQVESKKLELYTTELTSFEKSHASSLKSHENTLDFEVELLKYNGMVDDINQQNLRLEGLEEEYDQYRKKLKLKSSEIQQLLKNKTEEAHVETELDKLLKRYQQLDSQKQIKGKEFTFKKDNLNTELKKIGLIYKSQDLKNFKSQLKENLADSHKKVKGKPTPKNKDLPLEEQLKTEQKRLDTLKDAKYESKAIYELEAQLKTHQKQVLEKDEQLQKYPGLIEEEEQAFKQLEIEVKNLETQKENEQLRLEVKDLRQQLQEGQACPVCGSHEHPYASHLPKPDSELDTNLKEKKTKKEKVAHALAALKTEEKSHKDRLTEEQRAIEDLQPKMETKTQSFRTKYASIGKHLDLSRLEELELKTKKEIELLEAYAMHLKEVDALEASILLLNELETIADDGLKLKKQMNALYNGDDLESLVSQLKSRWIQLNSNLSSTHLALEKEKDKLKLTKDKLHRLQLDLESKVKANGFSSISHANSSRMKSVDYQNLSQQLRELSQRRQIQQEKINGITTLIAELSIDHFNDTNEAKQAIEGLKASQKETREELEEVNRALKNNAYWLGELKTIEATIAEDLKANKKWELLNTLIGDAQGHKFNKFAQDLSLQRLIHLGNKRLQYLNERYELDRYLPEEDKDQLYVIDKHMGGIRRSVKTLSGGETFLMSLALALGLSDLASKNVEINSLFIDEGFGTLDPETLDLTLDTLERLQAESNKTIGIISHVGALKERIQTQIRLDRNAQGYSSLEVVGY